MIKKIRFPKTTIFLKGSGDSMWPFLKSGTFVIVDTCKDIQLTVGDIVAIPLVKKNQTPFLHRVIEINKNIMRTKGDGEILDDGWTQKSDVMGKAIYFIHHERFISLQTPKARLMNRLLAYISYHTIKNKSLMSLFKLINSQSFVRTPLRWWLYL